MSVLHGIGPFAVLGAASIVAGVVRGIRNSARKAREERQRRELLARLASGMRQAAEARPGPR